MKITLSYKAKTHGTPHVKHCINETLKYYQNMLTYLIPIIEAHHEELTQYTNALDKRAHIEHLIHATKTHPTPKYDYDQRYPRCPSYLRRDAITDAISIYESYKTNHDAWAAGERDENTGEPQLSYHHAKSPTFYRDNMWKNTSKNFTTTQLKLYNGKHWEWVNISINKQDAKYLNDKRKHGELLCPRVELKGKKILLRFPVQYKTQLCDESLENERICAIDLGINTDATCVIMEADGAVLDRNFIKLSSDKARLYHELGCIKKSQALGSRSTRRKWRRANQLNDELVRKTVRAVMDYAIKWSCTSLVCEFLDTSGKICGSKKQKLHVWRKRAVYHRLYDQAHVWGLHVHQVCAWNTSKLAFDGSGVVERGHHICDESGESLGFGFSMVRFSSGKLFNADLNAALNIGARYFVRSYLKAYPVMDASPLKAKVLGAAGGSTVVLASLINLRRALELGHVLESTGSLDWELLAWSCERSLLGPCC